MTTKNPPTEPKVLTDAVKDHNELRNALKSLERQVARAGRGAKVTLKDGNKNVEISTADLNKMHSALNRQVVSISREYGKAYKYDTKKAAKKSKPKRTGLNINSGLTKVIRVDDNMLKFINRSGDNDLIRSVPTLLGSGIGSLSLLAAVLRRYIKRNGLVDEATLNVNNSLGKRNGQLFSADNNMRQLLGPYFSQRSTKVDADLKSMGVRDGDMKTDKDRKYFVQEGAPSGAVALRNFNDYFDSNKNIDRLVPKYNDYYHALDLDNLNMTAAAAVLASAAAIKYAGADLTSEEAKEYGNQIQKQLDSGLSQEQVNYGRASENAMNSLGLSPEDDGARRLNARSIVDTEFSNVKKLD